MLTDKPLSYDFIRAGARRNSEHPQGRAAANCAGCHSREKHSGDHRIHRQMLRRLFCPGKHVLLFLVKVASAIKRQNENMSHVSKSLVPKTFTLEKVHLTQCENIADMT